ncbi:probable cytochrome P450 305a1 [Photinus pyralis]|uniref:probable cytochrome P450 305a1 n=1 Tax=Photinus pyralis TaxID=7054 RepID=UPI0012675DFA|nr:probable cytochrome P450 305a1 [Photinus pyralis]
MLVVLLAIVCLGVFAVYSMKKPKHFPPGPMWWPLVGCSVEMRREMRRAKGRQQIVLEKMCRKWNTSVVGMKMGSQLVVCVSSFPVLKKVFDNEAFFARPNNFFTKLRTIGSCPGITCAEGSLFEEHKRFVLKNLQSRTGKMEMEAKIFEELEDVKQLIDDDRLKVQFGQIMQPAVVNIIWSFIAGQRIKRSDPKFQTLLGLLDARSKAFDMGGGTLSNFPWLRFIAPDWVGFTLINNLNMELKSFFTKTINDHYSTWGEDRTGDLIYSFISQGRTKDKSGTFTDDQLLMIILDLFVGGAHSSAAILDFAFLMMMHYPDVKHRVQACLDDAFASSDQIQYQDRHRIPYVEATLSEVMRYCHVFPVGGSRRALRDTELEGYTIPKDTTVLIDLYSVLNSKDVWGDPENFRPERFMVDDQLAVIENYIPFGIGRRRCLGESLARRILFLVFAEVMKTYDILPEEGAPLPPIDPQPGITALPQPYKARFVRRDSVLNKS